MLSFISGRNRTPRRELSTRIVEAQRQYEELAAGALLRARPAMENFGADLCVLDAGDVLELFWQLTDLGGRMPGGWHQVTDLQIVFERADGQRATLPLSGHIAGFHAWYRMRGGMPPIVPLSFCFGLEAGRWQGYLEGKLEDAQPLCLFADAFADLFHEHYIRPRYNRVLAELREAHVAGSDLPSDPVTPFRLPLGELTLPAGRNGVIRDRQANRLCQVPVHYRDVAGIEVPPVDVPPATPLDPVNYLDDKLHYLHEQSIRYMFCPYDTVNHWDHEPVCERTHYYVSDRCAYFHIEALAPLYRATGNPAVYRTTRKWYETIARNIWPMPGGGTTLICGDRTLIGSALHNGGVGDALCTFAEIDGQAKWLEPARQALLSWPMHPTLPRPLMDQDAWGNEEMNTTGTYNMVTHFALAIWRIGHLTGDATLMARAERILDEYTFPGEQNGIWPYRAGNYPSHHYDMYLKWQLTRLLLTGADRWTRDAAFTARLVRGMEATLREYAHEEGGELLFPAWTHNPQVTHPANAARHGTQQLEVLLALTVYVDPGFLDPLEKTLRGLYRLLVLPEVDRCFHGSWFHVHGNLLALALHGYHVEGNRPTELRLVRR